MATPSEILKDYLPDEGLAAGFDKSVRTIKRWRALGIGPPSIRIGKTQMTHVDDARGWIEDKRKAARQNHRQPP